TVYTYLVHTMSIMMLVTDTALKVRSLRLVPYGGAPIDPALAEAAMERFGPVFVQLSGQGESPMTITGLRPRDHRGRLLTSAGTIRTDVEVRIVDEYDHPVPDGTEGEICVRGDVVMGGYWNDPAANAKALKGGWLHTGD